MTNWVEYRCPQCGKATVQNADSDVYCAPNVKHKRSRNWILMKQSPGAAVAEARRAVLAEGRKEAAA